MLHARCTDGVVLGDLCVIMTRLWVVLEYASLLSLLTGSGGLTPCVIPRCCNNRLSAEAVLYGRSLSAAEVDLSTKATHHGFQ